jgi:hypothetical protein
MLERPPTFPSALRHPPTVIYNPQPQLTLSPPPPNEHNTRVFSPRRKSKECVGPTPPSRSKTLIFSFRVFVAVHLHASGAGMGLGGERFAFSSASFLPSHSFMLHRRCVEGRFVQPSRASCLGVTGLRQATRTLVWRCFMTQHAEKGQLGLIYHWVSSRSSRTSLATKYRSRGRREVQRVVNHTVLCNARLAKLTKPK